MPAQSAALVALGRAVKSLRVERRMSQEELGFRSELHRTYISSVERGQRNASWETLLKIAEGLDVEVESLAARAKDYLDTDAAEG